MECVRQIAGLQHDQSVRFLHVGGGFGQKMVRCDADRGGDGGYGFREFGFDGTSDGFGLGALAFAADQLTGHFVDGSDVRGRNTFMDQRKQAVMVIHVECRPCRNEADIRTQNPGFAQQSSGFHALAFGFITGGDAAGIG